MTDPRLLIKLDKLSGFDPVGLRIADPDGAGPMFIIVKDGGDYVQEVTEDGGLSVVRRSLVVLDLTDAATRDRCARWLAKQPLTLFNRYSQHHGATAPVWRVDEFHEWWELVALDEDMADTSTVLDGDTCDALHELDPNDDARLPDGARVVDVLALGIALGGSRE